MEKFHQLFEEITMTVPSMIDAAGWLRNRLESAEACGLVAEAGLDGLRFHDLRHTGNTLAAMTGASTKELMARMGHSSTRAAIGYQHATEERDRLIASKLDELIADARE